MNEIEKLRDAQYALDEIYDLIKSHSKEDAESIVSTIDLLQMYETEIGE